MIKKQTDLNKLDFRITRQRQVILDEFRAANTHLTADEVYHRVRKKIPRVSLGTIYRNLEILHEHGFINKIEVAGHQKLFDGNINEHYHLRCLNCEKLLDVPAGLVRIDTGDAQGAGEFEIVGYRLELLGKCSNCDENPKDEDSAGD